MSSIPSVVSRDSATPAHLLRESVQKADPHRSTTGKGRSRGGELDPREIPDGETLGLNVPQPATTSEVRASAKTILPLRLSPFPADVGRRGFTMSGIAWR